MHGACRLSLVKSILSFLQVHVSVVLLPEPSCLVFLHNFEKALCDNESDQGWLTLKAPITTAADDIHKYFFIVFQRK